MPSFNELEILQFFASLVRVSAMFLLLPIFGDNTVPPLVRIFLAFTINLIIYPVAVASGAPSLSGYMNSEMGLALLVMKESMVGFVIGFTAKMFFDGLNFAFGHLGNQMGFNMATIYDSQSESSVPVISQLIMILAMLIFLGLDGHHLFIQALAQSYRVVPIGEFVLTKAVALHIVETSSQVFLIAAKLSAPMALMIFLINCAFGIISKAVPQINVLIVSFTVNILAGFLIITLTLPVFGSSVNEVFEIMIQRVMHLFTVMA